MFLISLMFGTLIAISATSWFSMWMGLEINLLSLIPLMSKNKFIFPAEAAMKYFLTQTMASIMFLFSIITSLNMMNLLLNSNLIIMMLLNSALLIKMGAAPFHFWFPEIMEGLNWNNCILLLTWQKIAPMIMLMQNMKFLTFLSLIIISSSIVSSILSLNQISLRKMISYSSINHIGWMLATMLTSQLNWLFYFMIYSLISLNLILIFKKFNMFFLKQLMNSINQNKMNKFILMLNFLSLGGLPPFIGFLPKWFTIYFLVKNNFIILTMILIIFTLIMLFMYLRITFNSLSISYAETMTSATNLNYLIITFNFLFLTSLTMNPFILT
uniref:NADH-ubiquinone oxidoreductase chain 2 n=1 Tax=Erotylinae sp. 2 ACP-2013 TaxID=1434613 RepID=A0A3G5FP29_9CUCU|nr:NADH dehydrogenase subunit 2 [Erotylinae sp. 2 ACP-2013]